MKFFTSEATVPLRLEAKESAEMVSQLVFGDTGEILEESGNWYRIRCEADGYEGWATSYMLAPVAAEEYAQISGWCYLWEGKLLLEDGSHLALPLGARVPLMGGSKVPEPFSLGGYSWGLAGAAKPLAWQEPQHIADVALLFLNAPYLWGGRSAWGIDCSGLSQQVYAMCGLRLPRDASQQQQTGMQIPFGAQQRGDLVFFRKENQERVSHVGILCAENQIIHASGKVRLDFLDENGLIHAGLKQRTHWMVSIHRYQT